MRSGFLWLPKEISGEYRWLEHAKWEEKLYAGLIKNWWLPTFWFPRSGLDELQTHWVTDPGMRPHLKAALRAMRWRQLLRWIAGLFGRGSA
jgi:hypothetical protein